MRDIMNNKLFAICKCLYALLIIVPFCLTSCNNDDIPDESYYTFTGETLGQYLENRPEEYSEFSKVLKRCKLKEEGSTLESLMNAYGSFTCFAPDNEAMEKYLHRYGIESVEQMTDSAISVIARMHIINSALSTVYETKNFSTKLPDQNMYNKTVYIANNSVTVSDANYIVNETGTIIEKDLLVHNGVIHKIDSVLEPSDLKLDGFLEKYPEYSLFREAVDLTNIGTRLNTEPEDRNFIPAEGFTDIDGNSSAITPQFRYFYFTCFIETNEVFSNAGINTLQDMQDSARVWFQRAYADNPTVLDAGLTSNWEDPENYFNRFVAYHFVNKKIDRQDFMYYNTAMNTGYLKNMEYAESVAPNQLLYMAAGQNTFPKSMDNVLDYSSAAQLNPPAAQEPLDGIAENIGWTRNAGMGILLSETPTRESSNGLFHEIQDVLKFNRADFKRMRFRFEYASLFPEMMDNALRAKYTNGQQIYIPRGYLTNVVFNTEGTRLYYLNPNHSASGTAWSNYQGDEMMALGNFDFNIKLPPVPAGQYEVRFGYTANGNRGCAQIYMGTSANQLLPCGIPVDLTRDATAYGWTTDTGSADDYESDKILHANGWMKGPNSVLCANGRSTQTLRQASNVIRCVVGVINLEQDGSIYLRFRNATTNEAAQFMMDYLEVCPASIYDNPNQSEPRD